MNLTKTYIVTVRLYCGCRRRNYDRL